MKACLFVLYSVLIRFFLAGSLNLSNLCIYKKNQICSDTYVRAEVKLAGK